MKEISIYPSTTRLAKKFILPIIAILLLYFLVVVPDEDIGIGSGGFFLSLTVILFGTILALLFIYFYQLSIANKTPLICINKEAVIFPRHKVKFPVTGEYTFTTRSSNYDTPPNAFNTMDFILDRKESYLHVWQGNKRIKEIYITWMNLDENIIAALCNDLINTPIEKRENLLLDFYQAISKHSEKAQKRIFFKEATGDNQEIEEFYIAEADLSKEHKKLGVIAATTVLLTAVVPYFLKESAFQISFLNIFISSFIGIAAVSALIALPVSFIPYKKLGFKRKYLRSYFLSIIGYSSLSLILTFFWIEEKKDTECHEALALQKLKAKLVEEVITSGMYDPMFYETPDSMVAVDAINNQLQFVYVTYSGEVDSEFDRQRYGIDDPNAEACLCQVKVSFKDNDRFISRIRSKVSQAEKFNKENPDNYPIDEYLVEYEDNGSFSFSYVVINNDNQLDVKPIGYQIKELLRDYIEIK